MQNTDINLQENFNLRTAKMPRGYADFVASQLKVPTKRVYKVRYGEQIDKQVELALLSLAIKFKEEQEELSRKIIELKQRTSKQSASSQLALF